MDDVLYVTPVLVLGLASYPIIRSCQFPVVFLPSSEDEKLSSMHGGGGGGGGYYNECLGFENIQSSAAISFSSARSAPKVSRVTCELVSAALSSHAFRSSASACV